jgi:hypothetical protein
MQWTFRLGVIVAAIGVVAIIALAMPERQCPAPSAASVESLFAPCINAPLTPSHWQ